MDVLYSWDALTLQNKVDKVGWKEGRTAFFPKNSSAAEWPWHDRFHRLHISCKKNNGGKHFAPQSNSKWTLPVNCLHVLDIALYMHRIIFGANLVGSRVNLFCTSWLCLDTFNYMTLKSVSMQEHTFFFLIAHKVWLTIGLSLRKLITAHAGTQWHDLLVRNLQVSWRSYDLLMTK